MTRFLNGRGIWLFVAAGCGLSAYVLVTGAQTTPSTLTERGQTESSPSSSSADGARSFPRSVNAGDADGARVNDGLGLRRQHGVRTPPGHPRSVNVATLTERAVFGHSRPRASATGGISPNGNVGDAARSVNVEYQAWAAQGRSRRSRAVSPIGASGTHPALANGCEGEGKQAGGVSSPTCGASHHYPVNWRRRYRRLLRAHHAAAHVWHKRLGALREQLRRARHVQAHRKSAGGAGATTTGWPWVAIADCESGDGDGQPPYTADWTYNGPSGFDGGVQFEPDTWSSYRRAGEPEYAYEASPDVQLAVAERVLADQGWDAWPACSVKLGLR